MPYDRKFNGDNRLPSTRRRFKLHKFSNYLSHEPNTLYTKSVLAQQLGIPIVNYNKQLSYNFVPITPDGSTYVFAQWRTNNLYNPFTTFTSIGRSEHLWNTSYGTPPLGYDTMSVLYQNYVITGTSIKLRLRHINNTNNSTASPTGALRYYCYPRTNYLGSGNNLEYSFRQAVENKFQIGYLKPQKNSNGAVYTENADAGNWISMYIDPTVWGQSHASASTVGDIEARLAADITSGVPGAPSDVSHLTLCVLEEDTSGEPGLVTSGSQFVVEYYIYYHIAYYKPLDEA